MYANYENKFYGFVNSAGVWEEYPEYENDYTFSIPLFKAHVDTGITFYAKAMPQYVAKPIRSDYRTQQLAQMCQKLGTAELGRMFSKKQIQQEAMYLFLTGDSYRQITNEIADDSPIVYEDRTHSSEVTIQMTQCTASGCDELNPANAMVCGACLGESLEPIEETVVEHKTVKEPRKLPRPQMHIPNPVMIQTSHSSSDSDKGFVIKRQKIRRMVAEWLYQVDLSRDHDTAGDFASDALDRSAKRSVAEEGVGLDTIIGESLSSYASSVGETISEEEFWLDPSEYGVYFTTDTDSPDAPSPLASKYPEGLYLHIVGDTLIHHAPVKRKREWIRLTAGLRPTAGDGTGMYHLALLNDLINNGINLEYAILKTVGFPTTLLRSKYLSREASALDILLMENLPDEVSLSDVIYRVPAQNASGMLGVLSQRFEGYMQYIGGTWSPMGGASDLREVMGTATGASAVQEMMSDRLGLAVQMRVQADIETLYSVLEYIQMDKSAGNRQLLAEQFGESVVQMFFTSDIRSLVSFEAAKGTDEPQMDSVTAFKAQTYGSIVASMTGLRDFDKAFFYDFVAMMGEAFNLPTHIGTGRKEREVAKNQISYIQMRYKEISEGKEGLSMEVAEEIGQGADLFKEVTEKDLMLTQVLPSIQYELYDFLAMREAFSDWLQSNEGQNAPMAVRSAVAMLFDYSIQAQEMKEMQEFEKMVNQKAMLSQAMGTAVPTDDGATAEDGEVLNSPEDEGEVPDNVKRDGTTGAGRPRDVPTPEEPDVSDTGGSTSPIAFEQSQPSGGGIDFALGDSDA